MLPLLGLLGCVPVDDTGRPDPLVRNGVRVQVGAESVHDQAQWGGLTLNRFVVRLADNVLKGDGPSGEVSVSSGQPARVDVLSGAARPALPVFDFEVGVYDELEYEAIFVSGDGLSAFDIAGHWQGRPFLLVVEESLEIESERDRFELGDGIDASVQIVFRPRFWFEGLSLPDESEEPEDPEEPEEPETPEEPEEPVDLRADGDASELYEAVLARIVTTTTVLFPGEQLSDP